MIRRNRVVITGIGIVAPNGIGIEAFWESILAGRSGIGPITAFDASEFKSRIAGEVKDFDALKYMDAEWKPKRLARHAQLAYAASDVLHLHALKEKLDVMLVREGRMELAESCFRFLPDRARLDLAGWAHEDIFAHS